MLIRPSATQKYNTITAAKMTKKIIRNFIIVSVADLNMPILFQY